jgi:very-short-patch-repair endonuclease
MPTRRTEGADRSSPGTEKLDSRIRRCRVPRAGSSIAILLDMDDWSALDAVVKQVLGANDGVVPKRVLEAAGLTPRQIAAVFRRGVTERPRIGWYVDPALPWQAKHAVRVGGVLSCVSATDSFGLPVPADVRRRIHVLLPGNAPRMRHNRDRRRRVVPGEDQEVVIHWSVHDGQQRGWRTSLVDSLLQLADCVPLDWWIAALDAALHKPRDREPLMSAEEWLTLRRAVPERLRPALDLVDPRAESVLETLVRLEMLRRGITPVIPQFKPHPAHRVDFLVGASLIVEADGERYHDTEKDRLRDAFLRGLGYRVIRFSSVRILTDLKGVVDDIEAALAELSVV